MAIAGRTALCARDLRPCAGQAAARILNEAMRRHVYYYTYLEAPFGVAAPLLASAPSTWLPPPAAPHGDGWHVRLSAEGVLPRMAATRLAAVEVQAPAPAEAQLLRPVLWRDSAHDGLFPVLEADLELVGLNGSGCQLSLIGSYRPPLSVVGEVGDRLIGRHVAEACVRRFVLDIAERIDAAAEPATPGRALTRTLEDSPR
jgi:hypothetical protein